MRQVHVMTSCISNYRALLLELLLFIDIWIEQFLKYVPIQRHCLMHKKEKLHFINWFVWYKFLWIKLIWFSIIHETLITSNYSKLMVLSASSDLRLPCQGRNYNSKGTAFRQVQMVWGCGYGSRFIVLVYFMGINFCGVQILFYIHERLLNFIYIALK